MRVKKKIMVYKSDSLVRDFDVNFNPRIHLLICVLKFE